SGSTATYKAAYTSAGYKLDNNQQISYVNSSGGETLVTVNGVKSLSGISLKDNVVTVSNAALNQGTVTISNGYTLALGNDVTKTTTTAADWTLSGSTATYKAAYTSAGYKLDNNQQISYVSASGGETLVTVSGVKSTVGIIVDTTKKTVTLNAANLNKKAVTIKGGYSLQLASDVDTVAENISSAWTKLKNGNVTYLAGGKGNYYSLDKSKTTVTYNTSVASSNMIEFAGVKGTPTMNGSTVKLTANNFASNVSLQSNAGSYKVSLSGDFKGKSFTGTTSADAISNAGKNISIFGGKGNDKITNTGTNVTIDGGEGNDTLTGGKDNDTLTGGAGNDIFIYSAGKDVITDYASGDKISLGAAISATNLSGSDVVFTLGKGSLTVKNGKDKSLALIDSKGKSSTTVVSDLMTVTNSTKSPVTVPAYIKTIDASKRTKAVKITGNSLANSIVGGKGNDTLIGGKDNDVFIYTAGKDTITDYASGDKISLGAAISATNLSGSDVVFTLGKGSLTVKNGKNKSLALIDSKG
ncbi:MAG: hypothetical protein J5497_01915, partial [Selenomonadaceae bacterium]|nr:hypothetical protein [Selenomonadaceae bacterium]